MQADNMGSGGTFGERPVFAAELTPYRSLGKPGCTLVLWLMGGLCLGCAILFWLGGAAPIGAFFGLDFVILYLALRLNNRSGRRREEVRVSPTDVSIRKFSPAGRMVEHRFNPLHARFHIRRHAEFGILAMTVSAHGQGTEIGSFLNPDDRESFARAFRKALASVGGRL